MFARDLGRILNSVNLHKAEQGMILNKSTNAEVVAEDDSCCHCGVIASGASNVSPLVPEMLAKCVAPPLPGEGN